MRNRALPALAFAAFACAAFADAPPAPPATLPTPFSAEQIRDAWQPGFQVEMKTTEAGAESSLRMTVIAATAESVTIRNEALDGRGGPAAPPQDSIAKWSELRDHALFEASKASRERAECRSALGAMPGWRYDVPQQGGALLSMCFADAAPGPPVEFELKRGSELLSRTEHTRYGRPNGAKEKQ
jgi:hypothetical protein